MLPGRSRGLAVLLIGVIAGATASGASVWALQDSPAGTPGPAPVGMSGSMAVGGFSSRAVDLGSRYEENRDARGNGSIVLHLSDRDLDGRVTVEFSSSSPASRTDVAPGIVHSWGTVIAAFGTNVCRGSFGFSYFERPVESGGAVQLRCDDGSAFAAVFAVTQAGDWFQFDLSDGWYVPGRA